MTTRVVFLKDVNWLAIVVDGGVNREVRYQFDKNEVIDLSDDTFAAELVTDGLAAVSTDPVTTTEADKGIFNNLETATSTTGSVSVLTDNGNGTFTHNDGNGNLTTISLGTGNTSVFTDNGNGTFTHDDGNGTSVTFDANTQTVTSLALAANILTYTDEAGAVTNLDLSLYLDDTNLARLVSGTIDVAGVVTFTRDDASTFTIDMSSLLPVTAATAISPASDDAAGLVGVGTNYAREDHKHPAQGVSADAGNSLSAGTDGLHYFAETPNPTAADAIPPASNDATGSIGSTPTEFAMEDHKHPAQGVSADLRNQLTVGTDGLHYSAQELPLWVAGDTYNIGDMVKSGDKIYAAVTSQAGNDPTVDTTETNWKLVATEAVTGMRNFFDSIAPVKSDLQVSGGSGSLTINVLAGTVIQRNGNDMPVVSYAGASPIQFDLYNINGLVSAAQTAVPIGNWDNSGVNATHTGNDGGIWRLFIDPANPDQYALLYPQTAYTNWNNISDVLLTEAFVTPVALSSWIEIGRFRARADATDLASSSDAEFVSSDRFAAYGSASSTSVMTGADGINTGASGLVPAPSATDNVNFLKGDGTWSAVTLPTAADAISPAADDAVGSIGVATTEYAMEDHKHPAQGVSADAGNSLTVGTDGLHYFSDIDEVVENAGALAGAAPAGAQWGIDTTTGQAYYVDGGNWTAMPITTVDLNLTVSGQSGNTSGAAPLAAPGAPDTGDIHLEIYDDKLIWWSWGGAAWAASAETNVAPTLADATLASDDAVGSGGVASTAARSDHKHAAQGISADISNKLLIGTDGLHYYSGSTGTFLSNTSVNPTAVGSPTNTEALTAAGGGVTRDIFAYYTGTDVVSDPVTHVWYIDSLGAAIRLQEPDAGLTDVSGTVSSNNIDIAWGEHTRVATSTANDTITIAATSTANPGDVLEFYNGSANQMVVQIAGADTLYGAPASEVPASTGFTARIVAANQVEIVGTGENSSAAADRVYETVDQVAHGFTVLQPVHHDGTQWVAAQANAVASAAQGVVTSVISVDSFEVTTFGVATITGHGLTNGADYWLDQVSSDLTATEPTSGIRQQVMSARDANTIMVNIGDALFINTAAASKDFWHGSYQGTVSTTGLVNALIDISSSGTGIVNNNDGTITLSAGKTYEIRADFQGSNVVNGFYRWIEGGIGGADVANATSGNVVSANAASTRNTVPAVGFVSPVVDTTYSIRADSGSFTSLGYPGTQGATDIIVREI